MNVENYMIKYVRYQQLNWYGHFGRIPEKILTRELGNSDDASPVIRWHLEVAATPTGLGRSHGFPAW